MSDEFMEKYNNLNSEQESPAAAEETASAAADSGTQADTPVDSSPAENRYRSYPNDQPSHTASPQQPAGWQNTYYGTQANPYSPGTNPYVSRPVQSIPQPNAAYASRAGETPYYSGANTYVDSDGYYHRSFTEHREAPAHTAPAHTSPQPEPKREKKEKAHLSKGAVAVLLIVCVLISGAAGFGGSLLANHLNAGKSTGSDAAYQTVSNELVIHRVSVENSSETTGELVDKETDEITRAVADSVVEITTEVVQTSGFYGQYVAQGAGSGVIISDDGYIITNNHVIEDARMITVTTRSGDSYEATLIGTDADEDIALLKIEASGLTTAIFGDSSTLEVGDKAVIIGNPLGTLGGSVTEGILSALDRSIVIDGKTMHLMQTDAAINPGNSGGGMFNGQGELVGIVVAKSGGTSSGSTIDNIGFVIPINNVLNILGDLKQYGYVRGKADTGMSFVDITNSMYAWYYYNSSGTGVFISSVERGSNAAEAGFQAGDRVISVDGKKVSSSSEISAIISNHSAGDTITFELERGNSTGSIDLVLEEYVPESTH